MGSTIWSKSSERPFRVRYVVDKMSQREVRPRILAFHPLSIIAPVLIFWGKSKCATLGNLPHSNALSKFWEHWLENYFQLFIEG